MTARVLRWLAALPLLAGAAILLRGARPAGECDPALRYPRLRQFVELARRDAGGALEIAVATERECVPVFDLPRVVTHRLDDLETRARLRVVHGGGDLHFLIADPALVDAALRQQAPLRILTTGVDGFDVLVFKETP